MEQGNSFHTLKGYQLIEDPGLTPAMEDYLEMICRILKTEEALTIGDLSEKLNVRPSSATKMVQLLHTKGYLCAEKYGAITLTKKGVAAGEYLLYRHSVVHDFLCRLNHTEDELEETEKIEHFLSRTTVHNMALFSEGPEEKQG